MSIYKYTCTSFWKQSWASLPCPGCSGAMEQHLWSKQRWSEMSLRQKAGNLYNPIYITFIPQIIPPNLYNITVLWRVCPQGTLEWSSQDCGGFRNALPYSGSKEITCIHPQLAHTFLCTESVFLPGFLQRSLFFDYDVPHPKHSQEIEIIKITSSPEQNLMGNP